MKKLQMFCSDWGGCCTLRASADMVWWGFCNGRHPSISRGLPTRFATCPPRFALLLDLRKTHRQPALEVLVMTGKGFNANPPVATGMACLPKRSQGGGRRPGDMSGGRCAVPIAD